MFALIMATAKASGRADWEKGEIKLYCNQVFVSDSIKEVVPRYLLPLRGVIDSPDIPLFVVGLVSVAHEAIALRAILAFGSPEQRQRWVPPLEPEREMQGQLAFHARPLKLLDLVDEMLASPAD